MKATVFTLHLFERINLPGCFPEQANYERGIVIRDLRKKLELTQEEIGEVELKSFPLPDGQTSLRWNQKKDTGKEIAFTQLEFDVVRFGLQHMNKAEKLPTDPRWLDMYSMFMDAKEEPEPEKKSRKK